MAKPPKRPTRDEFVLEDIANQLTEAKQESSEIVLTVWGKEQPIRGIITNMVPRTGKVHVQGTEGENQVPFMDIMKVEYPRD
ncbi:hypothetical protein BVG16_21500 [Paenibacillus selenitireducens]|uniref:YolD-like family protein n=1 Tax=Paenibacillus selenitireducens TaxID=1324314 RepID=A0A1T2X6G5_9BACL|nr:hypothetical protein BVG16_21500 [Paenibacillus selenitireducens]